MHYVGKEDTLLRVYFFFSSHWQKEVQLEKLVMSVRDQFVSGIDSVVPYAP